MRQVHSRLRRPIRRQAMRLGLYRALAVVVGAVLVSVTLPTGAQATPGPIATTTGPAPSITPRIAGCGACAPKYAIVSKSSRSNYVDKTQVLGSCRALSNGTSCSISQLNASTNTVQTSFTVSKGWVTGQLGYSYSATTSISVTCNSPKMKKGQRFVAYPTGTRYSYKIKRTDIVGATTTSATLYSFKTTKNAIACGVA